MSYRVLVALLAAVGAAHAISMNGLTFQNFVQTSCYKKDTQGNLFVLGQAGPAGPLGQSMENFISLIEKLEMRPDLARYNPEVLAGLLLSR